VKMTHMKEDGPRSLLTLERKSLVTRELYMDPCLYGTAVLLRLPLTNICGLMRELGLILPMDSQLGPSRVMMRECITSSLLTDPTGRSRIREVTSTGHSKINAVESQTIKLKEILVIACMVRKTYQMLASTKPTSISLNKVTSLSGLVWETLNPQETNGKAITASRTNSPSMEGNGRMTLLLLRTTLELLETSVKEGQLVVTYGMTRDLIVNQNSSMVVG
jgi:hypothetical protein